MTPEQTERAQAHLTALDERADRAARHPHGRNFARTLRAVVSEVRLELGVRHPETA